MVKLTFILAKNVREHEGKYLRKSWADISEQGGGSKRGIAKTSLNFLWLTKPTHSKLRYEIKLILSHYKTNSDEVNFFTPHWHWGE